MLEELEAEAEKQKDAALRAEVCILRNFGQERGSSLVCAGYAFGGKEFTACSAKRGEVFKCQDDNE